MGEAEVSFLMPRSIFDNSFEGLIDELEELKFIVRTFSEISTGGIEEVTVGQISTSDPLFSLGMNPETVLLLGAAVSWALWRGRIDPLSMIVLGNPQLAKLLHHGGYVTCRAT